MNSHASRVIRGNVQHIAGTKVVVRGAASHRAGVELVERPTSDQEERVLRCRLLRRRPIVDTLQHRPWTSTEPLRVQDRRAWVILSRTRPLKSLAIQSCVRHAARAWAERTDFIPNLFGISED